MCSKAKAFLLLLAFLACSAPAQALQLTSLYYATCQRASGVIVKVDENMVDLLDLSGRFLRISRFDIVYLAYYPAASFPLVQTQGESRVAPIQLQTLYQGRMEALASGWPIDFSEKEISLLTLAGESRIIEKDNIWDVQEIKNLEQPHRFQGAPAVEYDLEHPYPFAHCEPDQKPTPGVKRQRLYPQQLLGDFFMIKRELDRLEEGYQQVQGYIKDKRFYPVPQVYGNENRLGMWANLGSRYGANANRTNNMMPLFTSELSEGPFGFQRKLVTGAGLMPYSLHEEPQSQFYYRLKADYLHFSFMYDYSRLLLGEENYKWSAADLESPDDRMNELHHLNIGFDYGRWAVEYAWTPIQYGLLANGIFFRDRVELSRTGYFYQDDQILLELYYGFATDTLDVNIRFSDDDTPEERAQKERLLKELEAEPDFLTRIRHYRLNLHLFRRGKFRPILSLIHRSLDFRQEADQGGEQQLQYLGRTWTGALFMEQPVDENLTIHWYLSLERQLLEWGVQTRDQELIRSHYKTGAQASLEF